MFRIDIVLVYYSEYSKLNVKRYMRVTELKFANSSDRLEYVNVSRTKYKQTE